MTDLVVHRASFEYHVGANPSHYLLEADGGPWVLNPDATAVLNTATSPPSELVPHASWEWNGDVLVDELTQAQKDANYAAEYLTKVKDEKLKEIDARTQELIEGGFTHAGKTFSLSINAQIKWMGAYTLRAYFTSLGAYPFNVNTKDDLDTHAVADEDEVAAIWQTVGVATLTILGGDGALKTLVRNADDPDEVRALEDTR